MTQSIECPVCDETKEVEVGTYALEKGIREQCFALYAHYEKVEI